MKDKVNEFLDKVEETDGFVFGSPVHFAAASGALTSFLDRVFYGRGELFGADTKNAGADGGKISCPGRFLLPGAAHGNTVGWRESQGADDETASDGADSSFAG